MLFKALGKNCGPPLVYAFVYVVCVKTAFTVAPFCHVFGETELPFPSDHERTTIAYFMTLRDPSDRCQPCPSVSACHDVPPQQYLLHFFHA